jgi:hypothetical protein
LVADRKIRGNYLKVAIAIGWHINRLSGWAHPGISTLAKLVGLSRPTVIRAVKWLEQKSHMRVIRTRADNRRGSNRYFPLLHKVATKTAKPLTGPLRQQCYDAARANCGERGPPLVTRALERITPEEVLELIHGANETGEDLGYVLWFPD